MNRTRLIKAVLLVTLFVGAGVLTYRYIAFGDLGSSETNVPAKRKSGSDAFLLIIPAMLAVYIAVARRKRAAKETDKVDG